MFIPDHVVWPALLMGIAVLGQTISPCEPGIRILSDDGMSTVEGSCLNEEVLDSRASELRFELLVERMGASGTSRSVQSGTFIPGTPSADTLSVATVSFVEGDTLHVRLSILDGDAELASTEIRRVL